MKRSTTKKKINESRDRFSKSKIKEIKINFYEIENKNDLSTPEIKQTGKGFFELENFFELNKYYDIKYKGIREVRNLFDCLIDEDYYKPIKTNNAFNGNYIE